MRRLGRLLTYTMFPWLAACGDIGYSANPTPPPPLILAQSFDATEDTSFSGTLSMQPAAGDTVRAVVTAAPTRGTLEAFTATGAFTYRPNFNLNGTDTFTVEATDSRNNKSNATITIRVATMNDAPVAASEVYELATSAAPSLAVLGNDTDVDGNALTIVIPPAAAGAAEQNPAVGTATVSAGNRIELALPAGFRGVTRVSYRVRDTAGAESALATAVVFVGTPRFDVWYQGTAGAHPSQVMVTDLASTRQVTRFVMPRKANGVTMSADQKVALILENDDTQWRDLWTVSTQRVEAPVRMTPGHDATQTITGFAISPDGAWVAYGVERGGVRRLWLVERANPAGRREIPLPDGYELENFRDMKFSTTSTALYFIVQSVADHFAYLLRAPVTEPAQPRFIYPLQDEGGFAVAWFAAPDDSYVVVRSFDVVRVSVADPTQRVEINAAIPIDDHIGQEIADPDVTRIVYLTTGPDLEAWHDDRLWVADVNNPGVSTLLLDADPARTGPISATSFRPDRDAVLVSSWTQVGEDFQSDLAEVMVSPADGVLRRVNPILAADTRIGDFGEYLDADTIIYQVFDSAAITRIYEGRRGSFGTPAGLAEPGIIVSGPLYSRDAAVIGFSHSRSVPGDFGFWGVLVNRTAPGAMLRVTTPSNDLFGSLVFALIERP